MDVPPYSFEYAEGPKIFAVRFHGRLTDAIFKEFYAAAPSYIERVEVKAGIADLTAVSSFDLSAKALRLVASRAPLLADPVPRFVVAPADHIYGMARMFQQGHEGRETLWVVRTVHDAYNELGVTAPHFERLL